MRVYFLQPHFLNKLGQLFCSNLFFQVQVFSKLKARVVGLCDYDRKKVSAVQNLVGEIIG